ncbi:vegetative incompatibility protein HET-E-1 [Trichophaea hybrida]|nr:vegetative incompatibility protein HET-E-1 [Trichophaea hybrida]
MATNYHNSTHISFSGSTLNDGQNFNLGCNQDEQDRYLSKLPCADGAAFNSRLREHEPQCLPDTRVDLLKQIMIWSNNPSGACIFWLNGMAGTGKSTIARTVARACADDGRLGASFFFSTGRDDVNHAAKFFTTLAAQLANSLPCVKTYICEAIEKNPDIFQRGLGEQWKYLILQPLSNLQDVSLNSKLHILVIDALDECKGEEDIKLIVKLLSKAKSLSTIRLRIFITSRLEIPIRHGFNAISEEAAHQDFVLHNISQSIVQQDMLIFFHHKLENIKKERSLPENWPEEGIIEQLAQRADKLFIYAATICRFIKHFKFDPKNRLSLVLNACTTRQSPTGALDGMYTQVLKHSVIGDCEEQEEEELSERFRQIVGSIILLSDPLSADALATVLHKATWEVEVTLDSLRSVLDVSESEDGGIRLLHPSFRDFLLDKKRCNDPLFYIDQKMAHNDLFLSCLHLMSKHLKEDMCNLQRPGALISDMKDGAVKSFLPLGFQYACRYWVHDLQVSDVKLHDNNQVHTFLRKHFLHWLEALSLMGKISDGVLMVRSLAKESMYMPKSGANSDLHDMVYDAKRIVLHNRSIIEAAPLQIYCSALLFSPTGIQQDWSPSLQTLEGHSGEVYGVAFSRDGRLLASASSNKKVRLWDPLTGASRGILEGHSFFGSGSGIHRQEPRVLLASVSSDKTVRLWDSSTGASHGTLEGHSDYVKAVAFSPDGHLLASASADMTVRLWDSSTGASRGTLEGHSDEVKAVAFSPDGQLLVSASYDETVRIWDPSTGASRGTLEGHSDWVLAVAFSPDGQLLASASSDKTVRLWDPLTGASRGILEGHAFSVYAVAFSPDGQLLASASEDETVRLWDPSTETLRGTLQGHSDVVKAVAFSPDSQLLASASGDMTVGLWDPSTGASRGTFEGHSDEVEAVAFSPDGQLLASASSDKTAVAFSPDGQLLASASGDMTVGLWDPSTGASCGTFEGHSDEVEAVAFSPDGQLLASASSDKTVRLWDPSTGATRGTLEGHSDWVRVVAFSPDGQLLPSASSDKTVRLWDLWTGAWRGTLEGHSPWVRVVAFSPDGQLLASASDRTVRLWDPSTGASRGTLEGYSSPVNAVAFSPDGHLLASAFYDKTVRLWDVKAKITIEILYTAQAITQLFFSTNGSYLETSHGILEFKHLTHSDSRSQCSASSCRIGVTGDWVRWGTESILWLPPDYRASCQSVQQNVLAIGHASGRVTFIEVDRDTLPLASV